MTVGCQKTWLATAAYRCASSRVAEDTDVGVGTDDEVRLGGAALVVANCLGDLAANVEGC